MARQLVSLRILSIIVGSLLLILGAALLVQRYQATNTGTPPAADKTVTATTDRPAETPVDGATYQTAPDQPRRITITSAGIDGFIQSVGKDQHGNIAAPNNVHLAGRYTGSVKPGDEGLSIVDGHVQGRYSAGIFKNLATVKTGAQIDVEYGDGTQHRFQAVTIKTVDTTEAAKELYARLPDVPKQLNLITCAGRYDEKSGSYAQRVIVATKAL